MFPLDAQSTPSVGHINFIACSTNTLPNDLFNALAIDFTWCQVSKMSYKVASEHHLNKKAIKINTQNERVNVSIIRITVRFWKW